MRVTSPPVPADPGRTTRRTGPPEPGARRWRRNRIATALGAVLALGFSGTAVAVGPSATVAGHDAATPRAAAAARSPIALATKAGQPGLVFRDGHGREVTLRGFNVAGSTKLYENGLLPFKSTQDAALSAQAMRDQTGANVIRFLITWEGVQPAPDRIDTDYLARAAAQIRQFTDRGIYVMLDYHQDLYSAYLFDKDSWYTGDGAPDWVIQAGNYPKESCGICLMWGQNMLTNTAVRQAMYDFWHNRKVTTTAGTLGVQDAFLDQAEAMMSYLRQNLPAGAFGNVVGIDPFNEPYDGGLDGATGLEWEKSYLMPFYQRFRASMDAAGWNTKFSFVEPLVFWNNGVVEEGGMSTVGALDSRTVFNSHYYDGGRMTFDLSAASTGSYATAMNRIRDRAAQLGTAPFLSEYGNRMTGWGSERTPWMIRAMYEGSDHGVSGAEWWNKPASGGLVLSSTQWHWDIYNGRHRELMNGNPNKVQTEADAWNDEDFSVIALNSAGAVTPRLDARVLDRLYPAAVAGDTLAFAYEDLARSGFAGAGEQKQWLTVPSSLPNLAALTSGRQYGVLVWRTPASDIAAPTELHLPRTFAPANTVLLSDLATLTSLPASGPISVADEVGSGVAQRLVIDDGNSAPGSVHVALVANTVGGAPVTAAQLTAATAELAAWKDRLFPAG